MGGQQNSSSFQHEQTNITIHNEHSIYSTIPTNLPLYHKKFNPL
uniref:Uncharacterized protein n=1 Tax=Arundo donax TaxID=35708 RepID=A0A0A9HFB3_ARUDO